MVLLSILGFAMVSLVATSKAIQGDQMIYDRAASVTQAGLEYAMRKIYEGATPVVSPPGLGFAGGSFTIGRADRLVTVTGTYGGSQVVHQVTSPSQADCTDFDVTGARLSEDDREIKTINFQKICLEQTVIDKVRISWTNPQVNEKFQKLKVENETLYDNPPVPSGNLTDVANYVMNGNYRNNINKVAFVNEMGGKTFTFDFIMGDGSSESYTFFPQQD